MAHVFKPTYTKPLPAAAELFTKRVDGEQRQFARIKPKKGRAQTYPVTIGRDGAPRIVVTSGKYVAQYRDGAGNLQKVSTGCRDEGAARSVLRDLERRAELVRSGVVTNTENAIADHQQTPLMDHFESYLTHLESSGSVLRHRKSVRACLNRLATDCGFRRLGDVSAEPLERWLLNAERQGMSARMRNRYRSALCAFCNWCVSGSRLSSNPVSRVATANEKADRRHQRRALTDTEIPRLLDATERRPLLEAMTVRRGKNRGKPVANVKPEVREKLQLLGRERRLIYLTLLGTGLRKSELKSISIAQVNLESDQPFIDLDAGDEKNRDGAFLPLRADLAAELREWIAERHSELQGESHTLRFDPSDGVDTMLSDQPLFRVPDALDKIMNKDLKLAGIPKRDERGRVIDVHALRTTFGTMLSRAGVAPRTAQAVMRHSDIRLTMGVYTDPKLLDVAGAVESLPAVTGERTERGVRTGTDGTDATQLVPLLVPTHAQQGHRESIPDPFAESGTLNAHRAESHVTSTGDTKKASLSLADNEASEERLMGIEPTPEAWEASVLPLNYSRDRRHDFERRRLAYRGVSGVSIATRPFGPTIALQARVRTARINSHGEDKTSALDQSTIVPVSGLEAVAYRFFGMRPARNAWRPAMQAFFMAWDIVSGSRAPAMPVLSSTPSQPSSIAMATSLAVPTPASTMTGYVGSSSFRYSRQMPMLFGLRIPCPLPIGLPAGITDVAPASFKRFAVIGSSVL